MTVHKQEGWLDIHAGLHGPIANTPVAHHSACGSAPAVTVGADLETVRHWMQVLLFDPDIAAAAAAAAVPTCKASCDMAELV